MAVGLFVMTVLTSACAVAHAQFDANGSITTLGRTTAENLLAEPVSMRIIERAFVAQESREVAAARSDAEIMVENQHTVLGGMKLGDAQRRVQRVIEDKAVAVHRRSRDGYSKRVQEAQLQWKVTRRLVAGGLQFSVTFTNRASRLRSLDVEFPVVLKGNDYRAFFPGQNDFPEWPQDMALAYGLRDSEWSHYNTLSQPTCTLFSNARDVGLTLAATYDHPILPISFYAVKSQTGTAVLVTFLRVRLDPRSHRTITLHFKVHEGDWRGGLAFVRRTWPELFRVSPEAQSCTAPVFGGTGSLGNYYPGCFTESSFFRNYMWRYNPWHKFTIEMQGLDQWHGQYMSEDSTWTPALAEKWRHVNKNPDWYPEGFLVGKPGEDAPMSEIVEWIETRPQSLFREIYKRGFSEAASQLTYVWYKASYDGVRKFIKTAREHGSPMFLYWNPRDMWYPFAKERFPDQIVAREKEYFGFDVALCAPVKGSRLYKHHQRQLEKMFHVYPELDGVFIDQSYGEQPVVGYDDGWTVLDDGRTAADLNGSLADMNRAALAIARKHGKLVWTNHGHETIDMVGNSDLVVAEDREAAGMGQEITRYATIGNRPYVNLQGGELIMQASLRNGAIGLTGHVPDLGHEDNDTRFDPDNPARACRLYYPMFELLRNKDEWCLEPHCLLLPEGFDGNLFRIGAERNLLATVIAFGENFHSAWTRFDVPVTINVEDGADIKAAYLLGAANLGVFRVPIERSGNQVTARIPRFKGAASLLFAKSGRFVSVDTTSPIATPGSSWGYNFVADNFTGETWMWRGTVWAGTAPVWNWEDVPAGKSAATGFTIQLPEDYARPFTQVVLAKEATSILPAEDGASDHCATFEFFVEKPLVVSIAPSRAMVMKTLSNSSQGGYQPWHKPLPLHVLAGETAELTLGIANAQADGGLFRVAVVGTGVAVVEAPETVNLEPRSRTNICILVKGRDRGMGGVKVELKRPNGVVAAADELQFEVFGTSVAEQDLAQVKAVSLYYDIWGSSRFTGADTKAIALNGVAVGTLVGTGGYPTWINKVKITLEDAARTAVTANNALVLSNPTGSFWKARNFVLELQINDGSTVHLLSNSPAVSSPADVPWAEGRRLKPGEPAEVVFQAREQL